KSIGVARLVRREPMQTESRDDKQQPALRPAPVSALSAELAALEKLPLDELRIQWRNHFGRAAPRLPRGLLLRLLAYRLQAEAFGDLDPAAVRLLDRFARDRTDGPAKRRSGMRARSGPQRLVICLPLCASAMGPCTKEATVDSRDNTPGIGRRAF